MAKVVVAMSGGVDSSVATALLKHEGHEVIGMMLRLWSEPDKEDSNRCCTPDAMAKARRISALLEIPFYAIDAREIFKQIVVNSFIDGYAQNTTPNPCITCNRQIRWGLLLDNALSIGADFLATGHYARIKRAENGKYQLLRGLDQKKDQSYVLHTLAQADLSKTLLPLGDYTKSTVRHLAIEFGLPIAERPDSQDLCFLAGDDYRNFLRRNAPQVEMGGTIVDLEGNILGEHHGLAFYTIGQRKGLGISSTTPLYVLDKDAKANSLIVGRADQLGQRYLTARNVNWIDGRPPSDSMRGQVKIRYTAKEVKAKFTLLSDNSVRVTLDESVRDITPGQAAVFYKNDICLGGGIIEPFRNTDSEVN